MVVNWIFSINSIGGSVRFQSSTFRAHHLGSLEMFSMHQDGFRMESYPYHPRMVYYLAYIYHQHQPNVGWYTIYGCYGRRHPQFIRFLEAIEAFFRCFFFRELGTISYPTKGEKESWEFKVSPPMPTPPRNKPLIFGLLTGNQWLIVP